YGVGAGGELAADQMRTRRWDDDRVVGDHRDDGPLLDSDRDGRGPIEEVIDGPDDPANPRRS
ncbi:MAG TPA: hypothetical protein GXZ45_10450, partial [Propionibacterium sp.]|nr:hypothetical protein [Propionibacterium sp.]